MTLTLPSLIFLLVFLVNLLDSTSLPKNRLLCTEREIGLYDEKRLSNFISIELNVSSIDWGPEECENLKKSKGIEKRSLGRTVKTIFKFVRVLTSFVMKYSKTAKKYFNKLKRLLPYIPGGIQLYSYYVEDQTKISEMQKNAARNILNGGGIENVLTLEPFLLDKLEHQFKGKFNYISLLKSTVSHVRCKQDSRIHVSLKIPLYENRTVRHCFDLGKIANNQYDHYEFPSVITNLSGIYEIDFSTCDRDENRIVTCPTYALTKSRSKCSPNNLEICNTHSSPFSESDVKIYRQLPHGMVVYGDVDKVIIHGDGVRNTYEVSPFQLYYISASTSEKIEFGILKKPGRNDETSPGIIPI